MTTNFQLKVANFIRVTHCADFIQSQIHGNVSPFIEDEFDEEEIIAVGIVDLWLELVIEKLNQHKGVEIDFMVDILRDRLTNLKGWVSNLGFYDWNKQFHLSQTDSGETWKVVAQRQIWANQIKAQVRNELPRSIGLLEFSFCCWLLAETDLTWLSYEFFPCQEQEKAFN